ncbi:hypothetical protein D9M71_614520 [compost metagenome]
MASGTRLGAEAGEVPIATLGVLPSRRASRLLCARSISLSMRRAWLTSRVPSAVGRRPRAWRSNSRAPASSSNSLRNFDSPGWVV